MQVILRKNDQWFILNDELLDNPEICRSLVRSGADGADAGDIAEDNGDAAGRGMEILELHGWHREAVA